VCVCACVSICVFLMFFFVICVPVLFVIKCVIISHTFVEAIAYTVFTTSHDALTGVCATSDLT